MLEIRLLGKIKFLYDGNDITEKIGSKTAALVALLIQQKKGMRREKIIAYLWPDSNEEAAKYNLRYNLWQLKKIIGPDGNGTQFLRIDKDYCGVDFQYDFRCDMTEAVEFDPVNENSIETLERFRDVYAGDFFEGNYFNGCDDFNELIIFQRNNLENCRVRMLKRLAELYEKAGNHSACLETLTEILSLEPYDENTALKTMSVYVACGNRGGAIRYYKTFCSKLICNLGIQPSVELKNKYNEIKATSAVPSESIAELEIWCMKDVEYFWMSDVVEEILKNGFLEDKKILKKTEIADLAYIAPRIAAHCGMEFEREENVPPVRIVRSFLHLLEGVCSRRSLRLKIRKAADMDKSSLRVFQFLKERRMEGLELQTEQL